jgi:hypothetical protein
MDRLMSVARSIELLAEAGANPTTVPDPVFHNSPLANIVRCVILAEEESSHASPLDLPILEDALR